MTIVVLGNGPAAIAAIEAIRERDVTSPITLVSKERCAFYSPCSLAEYVEQSIARDDLFLRDGDFYLRHGVTTLLGHTAVAIDPVAQLITTESDGQPMDVRYERLLIASGARAVLPPVPGLVGTPGVLTFKTLDDADAINQHLGNVRHAVVIGSGFIGLEAAQALHRRGVTVTVLEAMDRVLPQMLDADLADHVHRRLASFGVQVLLNSPVRAVLGGSSGVTSVVVDDREIECQLVVCAAGVRADVAWLESSGVATARGVIVNDRMETNLVGVYAAGDIVETGDWAGNVDVIPTWPNAVASGRTAGLNIAGQVQHFGGLTAVNVVRIFGEAVSSFGVHHGDQVVSEHGPNGVRQLTLAQGRIVGGRFIGDITGAGIYLALMKKQVDVRAQVKVLLSPRFTLGRLLPAPPGVRIAAA